MRDRPQTIGRWPVFRLVALAAVVLCASAGSADVMAERTARRDPCAAPKAQLVLQSRVARVDHTGKRGLFRFNYCYFADGRRHLLASESLFASVEKIGINATHAAWVVRECREGACVDHVAIRRLRPSPRAATFFDAQGTAAQLLLGARGSAVWTARRVIDGAESTTVIKLDAGGLAVLDRASTIPPNSLGLSADGRTVYWTNASQAKSASLNPA